MSEQKATNVHWHGGEINRPERAQLLGHGGATLWFTGLSGSGKSTIAVALEQALYQRGVLDRGALGIDRLPGSAQMVSRGMRYAVFIVVTITALVVVAEFVAQIVKLGERCYFPPCY